MSQERKSLETIWHVPDKLWEKLKPIFDEYDPPLLTGRKRIDARAALDAIIFRLRSGCQWNQLPNKFPDDSSVHRTFQRWERNGVLDRIWSALVEECEELGGVESAVAICGCSNGFSQIRRRQDRSEPNRPSETWNKTEFTD